MLARFAIRPAASILLRQFATLGALTPGTYYNLKGEWLREINGDIAIGITADSVEKVGELTYIDWPEQGA